MWGGQFYARSAASRRAVEKHIAGTCRRKARWAGLPALGRAWEALGAPFTRTSTPPGAPRPPLRERVGQGTPGPRCRKFGKCSRTRHHLRQRNCTLRRSTCQDGFVETGFRAARCGRLQCPRWPSTHPPTRLVARAPSKGAPWPFFARPSAPTATAEVFYFLVLLGSGVH
ncbi:hypothetical protein TraAM80_09883 [Trypanosoma rangeli]|uniref:Uncharacterized protein n=1 Tax=Trypanosoma rangeli TaxID=5698 RepID=A0A422MTJ6_TRYRA|nr:uncharacterized protein TraAM80_09883 [Trypanosoma rangeli]RNE96536.1 hypothetical protein TraAM80_09883 [Trypanosoma rangeli]|eukprot:RNE96536.1 hypothetical protein TraAM80_09883 [Trypanosoma rangeli]